MAKSNKPNKNTKAMTVDEAHKLANETGKVVEYSTPEAEDAKTSASTQAEIDAMGADLKKQINNSAIIPTSSTVTATLKASDVLKFTKNEHPLASVNFSNYESLLKSKVDALKADIQRMRKGDNVEYIGLENINNELNKRLTTLANLKDSDKATADDIEIAEKAYNDYNDFRTTYINKCKSAINDSLKLTNNDLRNKFYQIFDKFSAVQTIEIFCGASYEEKNAPEKTRKSALNALHLFQISADVNDNLDAVITVHETPATIKGLRLYREDVAKRDAEAKGEEFGKSQREQIARELIPAGASDLLHLFKIASARLFAYNNKSDLTDSAINLADIYAEKMTDEDGEFIKDKNGNLISIFARSSKTAAEQQIKALAKALLLDSAPTSDEVQDVEETYQFKRNNGYALYFEAYKKIRGAFTIVDNISLIDAFIIEARYARKGLYTPVIDTAGILKASNNDIPSKNS